MITIAFDVPKCSIIESLGIVRGISVRSCSVVGKFGAALQAIFGGNISIYSSLCEKTRQEAFDIMISQAEQRGANALWACAMMLMKLRRE